MSHDHDLYESLDELLSPETLSRLSGQRVTDVQCLPFDAAATSASGNEFSVVETNAGEGPRYIVKRVAANRDWIMRASGDTGCREMLLWHHGLFNCLPPEATTATIACSKDGDSWAILMHDESSMLLRPTMLPPITAPLNVSDAELIFDSVAAMQARFWLQPALTNPALGLCRSEHLYTCFGPTIGYGPDPHPDELAPDGSEIPIEKQPLSRRVLRGIGDGWRLLESEAEADVARIIRTLTENPGPLCDALARYPWTLIHGDPRYANLGIARTPRPRLIMLDWQLASRGQPAIELAWILNHSYGSLPFTKEEAIARYRCALARQLGDRFDEAWWRPQLELSLLGQFVRFGWVLLFKSVNDANEEVRTVARSELLWWFDRVREGVKWL